MARILVWSERVFPLPGGVERMTLLLADALRECGHELELITTRLGDAPVEDSLHGHLIHRVRLPQQPDAGQIEQIAGGFRLARQVIARFQPELMLLMEPQSLLMIYRGARAASSAPVVYAMRVRLEDGWGPDHMIGRTIREADYVVSCSDVVLQAARSHMPEITTRSTTILNALPPADVEPAPLPFDEPVFLCLGRLMAQKSFETAVRAFARIAPDYPSARLIVAGDGPERAMLEALTDSLGVRAQVEWMGWVDQRDVLTLINQATAVVMPSIYEGLPQVGIQAAQMGRPVLASAVDGMLELIVDGETGVLFAPRDDAALAAAMIRLLGGREAASAMGRAARARADRLFDWDRYVRRHDELFRRLVVTTSVS